MAVKKQTVCELCGRIKGESNHWLKGRTTNDMVVILVPVADYEDPQPTCDICGERCAAEFVSVWVHEQRERAAKSVKEGA